MTQRGTYILDTSDALVHVRIVKRPDITMEQGAGFAEELADRLVSVLIDSKINARALILDVREAPTHAGPKTRAAVIRILTFWEKAAHPVAIVVGVEPIKQLQFQGMVTKNAPVWARVVASEADAHQWCNRVRG